MRSSLLPRVLRNLTGYLLCVAFGMGAMNTARAEVKVGLSDWPGWVAWHVAEQKGFFKKHGAKVKRKRSFKHVLADSRLICQHVSCHQEGHLWKRPSSGC